MPFTVSHVAVVLPLMRTPLPASALVIGSMVPDLPVHLAGRPTLQSHSVSGILGQNLVLGLTLWVLWHGLLAAPALAGAPAAVRARCTHLPVGLGPRVRNVRGFALVVAALLTGSALHVALDSFTHVDRWGTHLVPALNNQWAGHAGYDWLQYGGSVILLAVLVALLGRACLPPGSALVAGLDRGARIAWAALLAAGVTGALLGLDAAAGSGDLRTTAYFVVTRACGLLLAAGLVLAAAWHLRGIRRPRALR